MERKQKKRKHVSDTAFTDSRVNVQRCRTFMRFRPWVCSVQHQTRLPLASDVCKLLRTLFSSHWRLHDDVWCWTFGHVCCEKLSCQIPKNKSTNLRKLALESVKNSMRTVPFFKEQYSSLWSLVVMETTVVCAFVIFVIFADCQT